MPKLQNNEPKAKSFFPELEEEVLRFWDRAKIFEQSVEREAPQGDYVFYDGPPFATGLPHHGHIVASLMKDAVPRYWTMRGFRVERKWGWDCHGLPIENIAEKELGFKRKKDILDYGIDKFNEFCRSKVLGYVEDWKKVIRRLGRWADMENSYKTMDLPFMESVWWVFKELWDKGLIYESYRSIHICPRCETTLSQQEVTEGYKEGIKDLSAVVKFELEDEPGTFVLAWTTTPWTLIANTALAVNSDEKYLKLKLVEKKSNKIKLDEGQQVIFLDNERIEEMVLGERLPQMTRKKDSSQVIDEKNSLYEVVVSKEGDVWGYIIINGQDLIDKRYKPLFDYYSKDENLKNRENGWKIYAGDFVSTEEGAGIVHIAPAFGEDDLNLGKKENLPFIQHLGMDGIIHKEVTDFVSLHVKPTEDVQATDKKILNWLNKNNKLFSSEEYSHNYPHCWRCETPLLNYVTTSWFVNVLKVKERAIGLARDINWTPAHIKEGRWGKWLLGARDWSISRQRFWASVMPIWRCQGSEVKSKKLSPQGGIPNAGKVKSEGQKTKLQCKNIKVVGSVKELEDLSGQKINDIHKHIVDKITFKCEKCNGAMKRVPDVLDTWFDSGSMPYAQAHYPFANKEKFEASFPAEFIAEGSDQTRAWFYYLHLLATAIKDKPAFKNVIVNGIVLAEDGKKMSKRLKNYTDPTELMERYGADAMRYYLLSSAVMMAEDLNFSDKGVEEALRKNIMILWNVYKFYELFATVAPPRPSGTPPYQGGEKGEVNVLDKWILARLNQLIEEATKQMNAYDLSRSVRPLSEFINDLSTWYLRRSRERFKGEDKKDKEAALATLSFVLTELSKIMAPFMPFMAEQIWQRVTGNNFKDEDRSVHLEAWPISHNMEHITHNKILEEMELVRRIVEAGLAARDAAGIKVRQALNELRITNYELRKEYENLIKDELNVKKIKAAKGGGELKVELDTELTEELKQDGFKREIIRLVNNLRKNAGLTINDKAIIYWQAVGTRRGAYLPKAFAEMADEIKKGTLSQEIKNEKSDNTDIAKEVKVNGETVWLGIKKN